MTDMTDETMAVDRSTADGLTGVRRGAFTGYRWLLLTFLLLGIVQVFLAGLGVFDLDGQPLGTESETAFDPHRTLGYLLAPIALLVVVLCLVARPGRREIVLSVALLLLVGVAQSALAAVGEDTPLFGGLHALDGMLILGIAGVLHARTRRPR
jgi:hypothetical protein